MCVLGAGEDEKLRYSGFMGHKLVPVVAVSWSTSLLSL